MRKPNIEKRADGEAPVSISGKGMKPGRGPGKAFVALLFFVLSLWLVCTSAGASWLIDPRRFHASVHGQESCQDCHENVVDREAHPVPEEITKARLDFFRLDQCLACHDDVMDKLEKGIHGNERVEDAKAYEACLSCHDPHDQAPIKEDPGRFDPSRPRHEQCGACHEERTALPPLSPEDEACMGCHRAVEADTPQAVDQIRETCFHCHSRKGTAAQEATGKRVALIDPDPYPSTAHAEIACTACHPQATDFNHGAQKPGDCRECHLRHDEKVTHDAHLRVTCEACHLGGIRPVRDATSGLLRWNREFKAGENSRIHEMVAADDEKACRRCHARENQVGAAAMVLPAKSILCMPCHAATFSVGDTISIFALMVFVAGFVMLFSYALSGTISDKRDAGPFTKFFDLVALAGRTICSPKIFRALKALLLDVLLQRRLYRQSAKRWAIHSLIFLPFVFRSLWGLVALVGSLWKPESSWVWTALDKNHPATAFLFDLTGLMVILGVVLAFLQGRKRDQGLLAGLPRQDRLALGLIGGLVVTGFIAEGMRIAMTGYPEGSGYAIAGYGLSCLFTDPAVLTGIYGYLWYLHAVLTGLFFATLPFSRLVHMIMAPLRLIWHAFDEHEEKKG